MAALLLLAACDKQPGAGPEEGLPMGVEATLAGSKASITTDDLQTFWLQVDCAGDAAYSYCVPVSKSATGWSADRQLLWKSETAATVNNMKRVLSVTYLQGINASAITEDITDEAIEDISNLLRESHKIKKSEDGTYDDDFTIRSQKELSTMMNSTSDLMTTLLLVVACISLVVGGIGIMNIMYVSVTERTREIGLRMSVGARGIDILNQFLIEAVLMSVTGGVIGIIMGIVASYGVNIFAKWPIVIQPWSVLISFIVCSGVGVFFGWYPARKAASLNPIEAIRYE